MKPSFKTAMLVMCILASNLSVSLQHEEHHEVPFEEVTLEEVCGNHEVPIVSVQKALSLIKELRHGATVCPEFYRQSFFELEPLLDDKDELLCSEKKFDTIKDYHFRYVNPKVESYKFGDDLNHLKTVIKKVPLHEQRVDHTVQLDRFNQELIIPISMQQFFKAWALQVSGICKMNFVENISRAMNKYTDEDLDLIYRQTGGLPEGEEEPVLHPITREPIASKSMSFDDLVYMPELEGELEKGSVETIEAPITLNLGAEPRLNKFMHSCKYRFSPVYKSLVMPIVRLSKLGYDYVGEHINRIRDKLDNDPVIYRWKVLTILCETYRNYTLSEKLDEFTEEYEFAPLSTRTFGNDVWIKGHESLAREFNAINGLQSTGFRRFLFRLGVTGRKILAFLDPHQFAWYRRNQNTLSSFLNVLSIGSNLISVIVG